MERVSINSTLLCGAVCVSRRTFGRNLVWLPRRQKGEHDIVDAGSGPFGR